MVNNKKYVSIFWFFISIFYVIPCDAFLDFGSLSDGIFNHADYGQVLSTENMETKNGVIHKIEIYPVKNAESNEKIVRDGTLVCYKGAKANVLICHGFMGNHHDIGLMRGLFPEGDYNCMTFDFRAHGNKDRSKNQVCTFGRDEVFDIVAAVRFLKNHPDTAHKPIIGFGFSMGASSLILAEQQQKVFDGLVLDCPFDSSQDILQRALREIEWSFLGYRFGIPGKDFLQEYVFHPYIQYMIKPLLRVFTQLDPRNINTYICQVCPRDAVKEVTVPCFFIICKKDARVPVYAVKNIFDNAGSEYKKLWITNGRWHCDSVFYNPEKYKERVLEFVDNLLMDKLLQSDYQQIYEDPIES